MYFIHQETFFSGHHEALTITVEVKKADLFEQNMLVCFVCKIHKIKHG